MSGSLIIKRAGARAAPGAARSAAGSSAREPVCAEGGADALAKCLFSDAPSGPWSRIGPPFASSVGVVLTHTRIMSTGAVHPCKACFPLKHCMTNKLLPRALSLPRPPTPRKTAPSGNRAVCWATGRSRGRTGAGSRERLLRSCRARPSSHLSTFYSSSFTCLISQSLGKRIIEKNNNNKLNK